MNSPQTGTTTKPAGLHWIAQHSRPVIFLTLTLGLLGAYLAFTIPVSVFPSTDFPRVLFCADSLKPEARTELTLGLPRLKPPRRFEVRTVPKSALHDRFVVPRTGDVLGLGTSLNGLGSGKLSVVVKHSDQAGVIRGACEERWRGATPIVSPAPATKPTATTAKASRRAATRTRKRA